MHACAIAHRRAYLHKLQRHRSRLEKQVAGKDNAGPSIGGTSTDFVSQNYLRIQNSFWKLYTDLSHNTLYQITSVFKVLLL